MSYEKLKDFIKPTWAKIAFSLGLPLLWILILRSIRYSTLCGICAPGGYDNCINYSKYLIIKPICNCSCIPLSRVISQYAWLLGSIVGLYLIYSTVSYFARKKN